MKIQDNIYAKRDIKTSLTQFIENYGPVLGHDIGRYYTQRLHNLRGKQLNRVIYQHASAPIHLDNIFSDVHERIVLAIKNKPRRRDLRVATPLKKKRMLYLHRIKLLLVARDISAIEYIFHRKRQNFRLQSEALDIYNKIEKKIAQDQDNYIIYEQTTRDLKHVSLLPSIVPIPKDVVDTCIRPYLCHVTYH